MQDIWDLLLIICCVLVIYNIAVITGFAICPYACAPCDNWCSSVDVKEDHS